MLAHIQEAEEAGREKGGGENETILSVLGELFAQIATSRKKFGVIHPKKFIAKVKKENSKILARLLWRWVFWYVVMVCVSAVIFNNMQQQDAHEFLNYLLNTIADLLIGKSSPLPSPPVPLSL